jgi:hypothetical protein
MTDAAASQRAWGHLLMHNHFAKSSPRSLTIGFIGAVVCTVAVGLAAAQRGTTVRQQILGAWQLESRVVRQPNGAVLADPVLGGSRSDA